MDPRALCRYNLFVRPAYVDAVLGLGWEEASRDRGASFGSLSNILVHIWDVENWHFHHVVQGRAAEAPDWGDYEDFDSLDKVLAVRADIEAKTAAFLDGISDADLARPVRYEFADRPASSYPLGEVLVHVATEEVHHRGELIALLWQMGIEPPPMTYLRYQRHLQGVPL